jgi:hypothetical protein
VFQSNESILAVLFAAYVTFTYVIEPRISTTIATTCKLRSKKKSVRERLCLVAKIQGGGRRSGNCRVRENIYRKMKVVKPQAIGGVLISISCSIVM